MRPRGSEVARLLSERDRPNLMRLRDPVSGASLGLLYRLPTTAERVEYLGSLLVREGEGAVIRLLEVRRRFGLLILQGLAEGDFELPAQDGGRRPVSSDPGSAHFEPHWKELIEERAPELVEALAYHIFEGHYHGAVAGVPVGEASKKSSRRPGRPRCRAVHPAAAAGLPGGAGCGGPGLELLAVPAGQARGDRGLDETPAAAAPAPKGGLPLPGQRPAPGHLAGPGRAGGADPGPQGPRGTWRK